VCVCVCVCRLRRAYIPNASVRRGSFFTPVSLLSTVCVYPLADIINN